MPADLMVPVAGSLTPIKLDVAADLAAQAVALAAGKADLASPAFTGNPTAPTQSAGNSSTRLATTAFVQAAITALVNAAPGALDTLDELAAALGDDANFAATMTTALAGKQPLDADLTAIAALTTASFGRSLLEQANEAAARTALGVDWQLLDQSGAPTNDPQTWAWSTNVSSVVFTGLSAWRELKLVIRGVVLAVSGQRQIRLSVDGGSTWFTASGDYKFHDVSGTEASGTSVTLHTTAATAARSGIAYLRNNVAGQLRTIELPWRQLNYFFDGSSSVVDAMQLTGNGGGNITAGTAYLYGKN